MKSRLALLTGLVCILALATLVPIAWGSALAPDDVTPPQETVVPGELIFQLRAELFAVVGERPELWAVGRVGIPAVDQALEALGAERVEPVFDTRVNRSRKAEYGLDRTFLVTFGSDTSPVTGAQELAGTPEVEYAEPHGIWRATLVPNDFYYGDQWAHDNTGQAVPYGGGQVGTPDCDTDTDLAWDYQTGDPNLILAVLDTGCDLNHPEYSSRLVSGYDFVNNDSNPSDDGDHGTACAGIALAAGNNSEGVAGVAWNVRLMPVKVLDSSGGGTWNGVADGIVFAADNGARILSLSLGGGSSNVVRDAVNYAFGEGCALFCASGNGNDNSLIYPARYSNTIAVGAMSPCCERKDPNSCDGEYWWGSNYGSGLDFVAPGTRIHTTDRLGNAGYENGDYLDYFNGTSSATPHAAGIGALVWSEDPSLTNDQLRTVLQNTCDDIGSSGYDTQTGYGRLNALEAVLEVLVAQTGACCATDGTCTVTEAATCGGAWQGPDTVCDPNPCPQPTGACCATDGTCTVTEEAACGGTWQGPDTVCDPNPCPQPTGACCAPDGTCTVTEEAACGGSWQGPDTVCDPNPCPQPTGGCCAIDGTCTVTEEAACGGTWQGPDTVCDPNPCPQPTGACCATDGTCTVTEEAACGGAWQGPDTVCDPNPCDQPTGACCAPDGTCTVTEEAACGGTWQGPDTVCDPNPCPQPTGACCATDGTCTVTEEAACGGAWQGPDTVCDPNPCPQPTGACCAPDGTCTVTEEAACGGAWQGPDTVCDPNPCDQPTGACCATDGTCTVTEEAACGGTWQGPDTVCDPNPCDQPTGACCAPDGTCTVTEEAACGGSWQGPDTVCDPNPCDQPTGACCAPDGTCTVTEEAACGGTWQGPDTVCDPNPCPQPTGACCAPDGTCTVTEEAACGGSWQGPDTVCDPNPCDQPTGACCATDGTCTVTEEVACGDTWQGPATVCEPNPCPQPTRACCTDQECELLTEEECLDQGGTWETGIESCDPDPCVTSSTPGAEIPGEFRVYPGVPNPFRDITVIRYDLPEATRVILRVFDISGNVVRTLSDRVESAGRRQTEWDGTNDRGRRVGAGVYFFRMEAAGIRESRSVILTK